MTRESKLRVLASLENKSTREGQRALIELGRPAATPRERERALADDKSEIKFVMDKHLKDKLEEVRSLLGPQAAGMSFAELLAKVAEIGAESLRARKFGKRRAESMSKDAESKDAESKDTAGTATEDRPSTLAPPAPAPAPEPRQPSASPRYISKQTKSLVWQRDRGVCRECGTRRGLNFDHIVPVARGGTATPDNLRLLCFACNQRAGIRMGLIGLR